MNTKSVSMKSDGSADAPGQSIRAPGASTRWRLLPTFNPVMTEWRGRRVWVVGASSGIGNAVARSLAMQGATVAASARNVEGLNALARTLPAQATGRIESWPLDVTDLAGVQSVASALEAEGGIDLVLYCAGHYKAMRATDIDLAEMQRHIDINQRGALHVIDAVLPAMLRRQAGHIGLVSSVAGFRGLPQSLAYGPTKAALTNLAENLYLDLHPQGLGISVIHPGFVQTPLTDQNDFHMPALITPEVAAQAIIDGWAGGHFDIHFPKRFTRWMSLLRILPRRLYFPAVRRITGL